MSVIAINPTQRIPGPFRKDRRCAKLDCITRLESYSPGPFCHAHEHLIYELAQVRLVPEPRAA